MRKRIFNKSHVIVAILLLLMVKMLAEVTSKLSFFDPVQRAIASFSISDIYYQIQDEESKKIESPFITIVDVSKLYDRGRIAEVIHDINSCQPAVIGFDVIFEGMKGDTLGSQLLAEAISDIESPIAAFKLCEKDDMGNFTNAIHSFFSETAPMEEGYINLQAVSPEGVIREMGTWNILNGDTVFSLPYLMAHQLSPSVVYNQLPKRQRIDYTPTKFPVVPYDSVLHYRDLLIKDRIVLLGTVNDVEDMHYSPLGRTAGSIIQAYTIQTLIEHHHIYEVSLVWNIMITFLVLVFTGIVQQEISYRAKRSKHIIIQFLFQSDLIKNVMNFIWMAILMWINFWLFTQSDIYFNPTIMLVCIALLVEVRLFYDSGIAAYKEYKKRKKHTKGKNKSKITEKNTISQ